MRSNNVREVVALSPKTITTKQIILFSILLSLFLAAMDSTVVGTLLPEIKATMKDVTLYPWLMSAFILTTVLATPLAGKASDHFGEKATMIAALGTFLMGSLAVCGASTMQSLVYARAFQGVGAGSLSVMAYILIGKLYSDRDRGRMQGMLSTVWGLAAILGPIAGALIHESFGWRVVFLLNVPLSIIAIVLMLICYPSHTRTNQATLKLDLIALLLFSVALTGLLILIMSPSLDLTTRSTNWLAAVVVTSIILYLLYMGWDSSKSLIPVEFFSTRYYGAAAILTLIASTALYASVTLLPLYLQASMSTSTISSGLVIMVSALGWVFGSAVCGFVVVKVGYKFMALIGVLLLSAGTAILSLPTIGNSIYPFALAQALIGVGIGFVATTTLVFVQNYSSQSKLGTFTSSIHLFRNIGAAIGINTVASIQIFYFRYMQSSHGVNAYTISFKYSFIALFMLTISSLLVVMLLPKTTARA